MKPRASELGLLFISIFISLAAVSALMEFIYIKRHPREAEFQYIKADHEFGWLPIPGRNIPSHPFGIMKINSAGFRSEEIIPGKKKILLLGDSVAFGYGVANDQTLGHFLSQKTEDTGYQVINAAVPGYGTDQEYLRLAKILKSVPGIKKVVILLFPNDLLDIRMNVLHGERKPFYSPGHDGKLVLHPIRPWDLRYWISQIRFLKKCLMMGSLPDKLFSALAGDQLLSEEEGARVFTALIKEIRTLLTGSGAQPLFVLCPSAKDFPVKTTEFSTMESLLKNEEIAHLNLHDGLKQDAGNLYLDEYHFTAEGNLLVADLISPLLFPEKKELHASSV